jgi:hypothetical protein
MKHYKIVKKTFYSLGKDSELHSESVYKPYIKWWFWWIQLSKKVMFDDGSTSIGSEVAFKNYENCEKFIYAYHKYYNKMNTYTIETVKKIDLE